MPTQSIVKGIYWDSKSYNEIRKKTSLTHSTIQSIIKGVLSYIIRKGKATKRLILPLINIKYIF
jgi:Mor family transcriptional regulator